MNKDEHIEVMMVFLYELGWRKAAEFVVALQGTVDNQLENNKSFVEAYRSMLDKQSKGETIEVPIQELK